MGPQAAGSKWAESPHVVMVPQFSPGHTTPFLQFARRLVSAGVVVTVVTSDRHLLDLRASLGTTDFTSKEGYPLRIVSLRDKTSLELPHKEWLDLVHEVPSEERRVIDLLESTIMDLTSLASHSLRGVLPASPPVCIVHDWIQSWSQDVADRLQIAKHLLYVSPASALSCALQSHRLFQHGLVPITHETRERIFNDIPGLPPTIALDLPTHFLDASLYDWMRHCHDRMREADVILLNTFYDLEKTVLDALRNDVLGSPDVQAKCVLDIGPLLPESYVNDGKELPEETDTHPCISWLNTRASNSVLYVSFGSNATHSAAQLRELALGLEASGVSFLWIVRPPNAPGFSAVSETASVTEFLPLGFEERVRDRGLCHSRWAPQMRILKHSAVGGYLSHCGWNSTLESICAGMPVLAWPISSEQHLNCRFLVDTVKVALELTGRAYTQEELESEDVMLVRFVSKEEIEKKARNFMHELEIKALQENVQKLRTKAREVGASGGSSRENFETYVRLLHNSLIASPY